jgi:hypothetical protein
MQAQQPGRGLKRPLIARVLIWVSVLLLVGGFVMDMLGVFTLVRTVRTLDAECTPPAAEDVQRCADLNRRPPGSLEPLFVAGTGTLMLGMILLPATLIGGMLLQGSGLKRQMAERGRPGTATIMQLRDTGLSVNDNPQADFYLHVQPADGSPPFRSVARKLVSRLSIPQPGWTVPVQYDPSDTSRVMIVGEAQDPRFASSGPPPGDGAWPGNA